MSQVNFFQTEADESDFLDYLKDRGDTAFVVGKFHKMPRPGFVVCGVNGCGSTRS